MVAFPTRLPGSQGRLLFIRLDGQVVHEIILPSTSIGGEEVPMSVGGVTYWNGDRLLIFYFASGQIYAIDFSGNIIGDPWPPEWGAVPVDIGWHDDNNRLLRQSPRAI